MDPRSSATEPPRENDPDGHAEKPLREIPAPPSADDTALPGSTPEQSQADRTRKSPKLDPSETHRPPLETPSADTPPLAPPAPSIEESSSDSDERRSVSSIAPEEVTEHQKVWNDQRLPASLISTIIHTLILIILALLSYETGSRRNSPIASRQGQPSQEVRLQQLQTDADSMVGGAMTVDRTVKIEIKPTTVPLEVLSPKQPRPLEALLALPDLSLRSSTARGTIRLPGDGGLHKRTPEGRKENGDRYGATPESERAVDLALAYLAAHQRQDGSWSFDLKLNPCNGQCRHSKKENSGTATPVTGATGLALLAFLGAGHTHQKNGPYQETVRRAIYYLRAIASEVDAGYDWQRGSMYGHGIALMALEEALCMTRDGNQYDSDLLDLVQKGASFTCIAQHDSGAWGYVPGSPGDVTVTGWQVLSLVGARKGGAALKTNTLPDAKDFLMSTREGRDYWFGYNSPPGEPTTSAIGLTLMMYLGQSPFQTPFQMALTKLASDGPLPNNIYHNYYATLALHHSRHHMWDQWNRTLRDHLVRTQEQTGHEMGSWHFPDKWGDIGGRLYTTALCAMTLEVYYRFMPLYDSDELFPL